MLNVLSMLAPKPWYKPAMPCSLRILTSMARAETGGAGAGALASGPFVVGSVAEGTEVWIRVLTLHNGDNSAHRS